MKKQYRNAERYCGDKDGVLGDPDDPILIKKDPSSSFSMAKITGPQLRKLTVYTNGIGWKDDRCKGFTYLNEDGFRMLKAKLVQDVYLLPHNDGKDTKFTFVDNTGKSKMINFINKAILQASFYRQTDGDIFYEEGEKLHQREEKAEQRRRLGL